MESIRGIFESLLPFLASVPALRAVLGFIIVFFLPGFAWTLVFFKQINVIERAALSLGLSIALVTLSVIVLNKLVGIKINGFNSLFIIFVVTIIPLAIYYLNKLGTHRSSGGD